MNGIAGTPNTIALANPAGTKESSRTAAAVRTLVFKFWKEYFPSHTATEDEILAKKERQFATKSAVTLLNYAIWHDNAAGDLAFLTAMGKFRGLGRDEQAKVMRKMQKELDYHSRITFDPLANARGATLIADFFAQAVEMLPKNREGRPEAAPYQHALEVFAAILEGGPAIGAYEAATAAAKVLWNLYPGHDAHLRPGVHGMINLLRLGSPAYGSFSFWSALLQDSTSRPAAIEKLLEMGPAENPTEDGWSVLRRHIYSLGRDIAMSRSGMKTEFFRRMILDSDLSVVAWAFQGASYLDEAAMPPDLRNAAAGYYSFHSARIGKLQEQFEKAQAAAKMLRSFGQIAKPNALLAHSACIGKLQEDFEKAQAAAKMLRSFGQTQKPNALMALYLDSLKKTAAQLEPLSAELGEAILMMSATREFHMISGCKPFLKCNDDRKLWAAQQILQLYREGRHHLTPMILGLTKELSEVMTSATAETDGAYRSYRENTAIVLTELLIATDPRNCNGAMGRTLETLSNMLQHNDYSRFRAATAFTRLGAEMVKRSNTTTMEIGGAGRFLLRDNALPLRKELTDTARAMVKAGFEPVIKVGMGSGLSKESPNPAHQQTAIAILNALIGKHIMRYTSDGMPSEGISIAEAAGIDVIGMARNVQLRQQQFRHQRRGLRMGIEHEAMRVLPPGAECSRRDNFRLQPLADPARR